MNDGAPGLDNARITYVKQASTTKQRAICNVILEITNKHPSEWETFVKTGLVVPLFKKVQRDDINNFRGVCLLSMASRILARIMASRLKIWAEAVVVLDENQDGFRIGRSTADVAQICVRLHEEARLYVNESNSTNPGHLWQHFWILRRHTHESTDQFYGTCSLVICLYC